MIDRRTFFRGTTLGLGGLYFSQFIRQLEAAQTERPARVLFFVPGNGVYPAEIQPQGIGRPKTPFKLEDRTLADHRLAFSMEPLQPRMNKMTMIHGLG